MLEFQNVSLHIQYKSVLQNINFPLVPGELVALVGPSGAGKSSIFRLILGEWKPTGGSIRLDDFALNKLSLANLQKYRRQIGVVFQDFRLLPKKTVAENIAFALEVCGDAALIPHKVPQLLRQVNLWEKRNQFATDLSGGEKQRTAIARALVHDPKILIADEPTGNLDPRTSREIAKLFARLHSEDGRTLLIATHDPLLIEILHPRVIRLEDGRILFDEKRCSLERAFEGMM